MVKQKDTVLRVGLDLDGVILYNPARIIRPIVVLVKRLLFHKKKMKFTVPNTKLKQYIWYIFHKSSIFVAPGFEEIKELSQKGDIEVYIITGRYSFLKDDFFKWIKKINADKYFKGYFYNKDDEQPHIFKDRMIKELDLDVFVEDNWDIVNYITTQGEARNSKTKVFWIYNILDRNIPYIYKFPVLKDTVKKLKQLIS